MKSEKDSRHIGHTIHKLNNVMFRGMKLAVSARCADEVTGMNGWILAYLHNNRDVAIYQKDVEKEFSIGRSAVAKLVARMEDKGFLTRCSTDKDARLKQLVLTDKGEEQFQVIASTFCLVNARQLEGISEEELEQCFRTLKKIEANAEKMIQSLERKEPWENV